MAAQWSDYQQTQGYMAWFYWVKFAVVSAIALGFASFSVSRMISATRRPTAKESKPKETEVKSGGR